MFRNNYDNDAVTLYEVDKPTQLLSKLIVSTARRKAASSKSNMLQRQSSKDRSSSV